MHFPHNLFVIFVTKSKTPMSVCLYCTDS